MKEKQDSASWRCPVFSFFLNQCDKAVRRYLQSVRNAPKRLKIRLLCAGLDHNKMTSRNARKPAEQPRRSTVKFCHIDHLT